MGDRQGRTRWACLGLLVSVVLSLSPCQAQPLNASLPAGVPYGHIQGGRGNIPGTTTAITFSPAVRHIDIWTTTGGAVLHVDLNGNTATTADPGIEAGGSFHYEGEPVSEIEIIGASASGSYNYVGN